MPLYMVTHTIEVVTAKVPLNQIMLLEAVKRKSIPAELKVRVVLPTGSTVSISLWDAPSAEELLAWLNENLQYDAAHEVHEVQEEFAFGLTTLLSSVRAAEKVAAGSRSAVDRLSATAVKAGGGITRQLEVLDQRTGVLTAAESAFNRVRHAAASTLGSVSGTGSSSAGGAAGSGLEPGMEGLGLEGEQVAGRTASGSVPTTTVAASMTAGLTKAGSTLSWLGSTLKEQIRSTLTTPAAPAAAGATQPGFTGVQDHTDYFPPPAYDTVVPPNPPPAYGTMPFDHLPLSSTPAAAAAAGGGAAAGTGMHGRAPSGHHDEEDVLSISALNRNPPASKQPSIADATPADAKSGAGDAAPATKEPSLSLPASTASPQFTLDDDDVATPGAAKKA